MVDFVEIRKKKTPGVKNSLDIYPEFKVHPSKDLMAIHFMPSGTKRTTFGQGTNLMYVELLIR